MIDRLVRLRDDLKAAEARVAELRAERALLARQAILEGVRPSVVARTLEITTQRLADLRKQ